MAEFHFDDSKPDTSDPNVPWYKTLTRYHWFVFGVAALGWLFDCLDQQLFVLARPAVMKDLYNSEKFSAEKLSKLPENQGLSDQQLTDLSTKKTKENDLWQDEGGKIATSVFLAGWALGGIIFGVMGDRIGRAKTMMITILLYSLFTGLSSLSTNIWDFSLYRFLTGLGVGGEFAVGVALVSEVMPNRARPYTLGLLQALSAVGNVSAALINLGLGIAEEQGLVSSPWRIMFLIGILPGLLAVIVQLQLREPEAWKKAMASGQRKASFSELLGNPRWRWNAMFGLMLAIAGVVGLWAIGFYSTDLTQTVLTDTLTAEAKAAGMSPAETARYVGGQKVYWTGITSLMINIGAFFGMFAFSWITSFTGRRPTFALFFVLAAASTAMVFAKLNSRTDILWMVPIMGFCQLALFSGYAIYFPELFPTRLRATGTSFCYNVGRLLAAFGPPLLAMLSNTVFSQYKEPTRWAGVAMCSVFLIGLLALPFLPETRGKPLPEE